MAERKRRADMDDDRQRHWPEVVPEKAAEIYKRLRSKASCQDRYFAENPYEFPADEEAAQRIIAAHWARKEAAAAHAAATDATGNGTKESTWISGKLISPPTSTSQRRSKSHPEIILNAGTCGLPSFVRLASTEPELHVYTESWKRAPPVDDPLLQLPRHDPVLGGTTRTDPLRSPRAPVLLGLERQYCQPQPHPWVPHNSDFFQ
ncbi:hypothetical protein Emag_003580 [Eimeria magna]